VLIEARGVTKAFSSRRVLRGVDLGVRSGERVVLLGENGSGKSTLLQVLASVLPADEGSVEVRGSVGFGPERPDLPDHLVVAEWLALIASLKGVSGRAAPRFDVAGLGGIKLGALSLGQRQRVSLATAWLGDPDLLLLDEPTNALDLDAREALGSALVGRTAVIATHDRAFAESVATRLLTLRDGALAG
jgi:ABC-type multidrug transport system ATPase subunit